MKRVSLNILSACVSSALMAMASAAMAQAGAPSALPSPSLVSQEQLQLERAAAKVAGWSWRGIGDPLVLDKAVVLFGIDDRTNKPVARRLDWADGGKVTDVSLERLNLNKDRRYTSAANSAGIWMAGPGLALITPSGKLIQAQAGIINAERPPIVALPDGSALIFKDREDDGDKRNIIQARLSPDGTSIVTKPVALLSYDGTPNQSGKTYRMPLYAHGVQLLADGRVLMFGDDRTPNLASIFDPATAKMTPVASMPNARSLAASTRLDDGRVVVAGSVNLRCYGPEARKVDLFDVKTSRWDTLPDLPLPLCAEAYSAWQPSVIQASNGSLVLGGGLEPELLVLERDPKGPLGFASQWRRAGFLSSQRIGGRLQALPGARVAVIGGVGNPAGFGSCCERTPGIDVVDLKAAEPPFFPGALTLNGPGVAQRGSKVFLAGGRRFMTTSTGQMRFGAEAELLDLKTGARTQLPAVPVVAGALDAFWIDDDRVIVKGIAAKSDRGFEGDYASAMPDGSTRMAIYSFSANRWQVLGMQGLDAGRLVGVTDVPGKPGKIAIVLLDQRVYLVNLGPGLNKDQKVEPWSGAGGALVGIGTTASARLVSDGRLVVTSDQAASDMISVLDEDCDAKGSSCPEQFVEIGQMAPAAKLMRISIADPSAPWAVDVAPKPNGNVRNTIAPNGDVLRVIWEQPKDEAKAAKDPKKGWVLRRWLGNKATPGWETLPTPAHWSRSAEGLGVKECGNGSPGYGDDNGRCQLLALEDPRDARDTKAGPAKKPLIFLRATLANRDYAWSEMNSTSESMVTTVHWLDEANKRWVEVLRVSPQAARATPQTLTNLPGKPLKSIGWHLGSPLLWSE